jgi:hypothetical protein
MHVAERFAQVIFSEGLAEVQQPRDLRIFIESQIYRPEYTTFL